MNTVPNHPERLHYRPEIDGLRAIAVVSVILYHARFVFWGRDWFAGGYIGVDVFFVISGYLITGIILAEYAQNARFGFVHFYERRARRILPMLFFVISIALTVAWFNYFPQPLVDLSKSALAAVFFGANFWFYFDGLVYGGESALTKPLLHSWSLGVEEQFYLVFPVLVLVTMRFSRRVFLAALIVAAMASLIFSIAIGGRDPSLNFYLPFSRVWELAVGALIAAFAGSLGRLSLCRYAWILSAFGLFLVIASILMFDAKTNHPGLITILPVAGVALIIVFASKADLIGRFLASRPLVWMGLISYSAYLWHYPIFAMNGGGDALTGPEKLKLIAITLVLSVLTFWGIERPFRSRARMSAPVFWGAISAAFLALGTTTGFIILRDGSKGRFTASELSFVNSYDTAEFRRLDHPLGLMGRQLRTGQDSINCNMRDPDQACRFGAEKIVFLGDSFLGQYERTLIDGLQTANLGFISFNYEQCPFVSDQIWFGNAAECPLVNERRRRIIDGFTDRKIFVLSANISQFSKPKRRTDAPLADGRRNRSDGESLPADTAWNAYFENINWLTRLGHKVVLVRSVPSTFINAQRWLAFNHEYIADRSFPDVYNRTRPSEVIAADNGQYPAFSGEEVLVIDPANALCDLAQDRCLDVKQGLGPLYSGGHLSHEGASLVSDLIRKGLISKGWATLP